MKSKTWLIIGSILLIAGAIRSFHLLVLLSLPFFIIGLVTSRGGEQKNTKVAIIFASIGIVFCLALIAYWMLWVLS